MVLFSLIQKTKIIKMIFTIFFTTKDAQIFVKISCLVTFLHF